MKAMWTILGSLFGAALFLLIATWGYPISREVGYACFLIGGLIGWGMFKLLEPTDNVE